MLAVTALNGNRVIAAYEDQSLRKWRRQPGAGWESQVVATLDHKTDQLQVTPMGRVRPPARACSACSTWWSMPTALAIPRKSAVRRFQ